jgi:hypothetical protein
MNLKLFPALLIAALVVAVAATSFMRRHRTAAPSTELLPYQARVVELPATEQERFAQIRAALREAEKIRAASRQWPAEFGAPDVKWIQRGQGLYVNYLGVPDAPSRLRWLVLIIEPEPSALKDPAPPEDEEHHTLSDGTAVHVSVWTTPNEGPIPQVVLPFPAAENWTQRLGSGAP